MSNADKLIAIGAQVVGGDLIWKHKILGRFRDGDLQLTEEGQAVLAQDIQDVEVKTETRAPRTPKAAKAKPAEPDTPIAELDIDVQ